MMKRNGWRIALGGSLLVTALGCSGSREVNVGQEGAAYNLYRCYGQATDCSKLAATIDTPSTEGARCEPTGVSELTQAMEVDVEAQFCADALCQLTIERMAAAPNGGVFALAARRRGEFEQGLVLVSYDADGVLLGQREVMSTSDPNMTLDYDLSVDPRGHAYVVWYSISALNADSELTEVVQLQEHDAAARPLAAAIALNGTSQTLVRAGLAGKVLLAGSARNNGQSGSLAAFDETGALLWNQNSVVTTGVGKGVGVTGLAVDGNGRSAVLTQVGRADDGSSAFALSWFEADGNPAWTVNLGSTFEGGYRATLQNDDAGNLFAAAFKSRAGAAQTSESALFSFDRQGQLRWVRTVESSTGSIAPLLSFDATTAHLLVALTSDLRGIQSVLALKSDGTSCREYQFANPSFDSGVREIAASGDGGLFVATQRGLARYIGTPAE